MASCAKLCYYQTIAAKTGHLTWQLLTFDLSTQGITSYASSALACLEIADLLLPLLCCKTRCSASTCRGPEARCAGKTVPHHARHNWNYDTCRKCECGSSNAVSNNSQTAVNLKKKAYSQKTAASLKRMRLTSTTPNEQLLPRRVGSNGRRS